MEYYMIVALQKVKGVTYVYLRESYWDPVRKKQLVEISSPMDD